MRMSDGERAVLFPFLFFLVERRSRSVDRRDRHSELVGGLRDIFTLIMLPFEKGYL